MGYRIHWHPSIQSYVVCMNSCRSHTDQNSPTNQSYSAVRLNPLESRFKLVTFCLVFMHLFLSLRNSSIAAPSPHACCLYRPSCLHLIKSVAAKNQKYKKFLCPACQILMSWCFAFHLPRVSMLLVGDACLDKMKKYLTSWA